MEAGSRDAKTQGEGGRTEGGAKRGGAECWTRGREREMYKTVLRRDHPFRSASSMSASLPISSDLNSDSTSWNTYRREEESQLLKN